MHCNHCLFHVTGLLVAFAYGMFIFLCHIGRMYYHINIMYYVVWQLKHLGVFFLLLFIKETVNTCVSNIRGVPISPCFVKKCHTRFSYTLFKGKPLCCLVFIFCFLLYVLFFFKENIKSQMIHIKSNSKLFSTE